MADERTHTAGEELLMDIRVAEASKLYKFYLNQEKKILGTISVGLFLIAWELVGNTLQLINPMFMSAPSLIWKATVQSFTTRIAGSLRKPPKRGLFFPGVDTPCRTKIYDNPVCACIAAYKDRNPNPFVHGGAFSFLTARGGGLAIKS